MNIIKNEHSILLILKFTPSLLIVLIAIFATMYINNHHSSELDKKQNEIKKEFIESNKETSKENILTLNNYINHEFDATTNKLKSEIKNQVETAHHVASSIYNKYKNTKSKEEILDIIKISLKAITYNQSRGYFFIYDLEGTSIFHPTKPQREGSNFYNIKDSNGVLIIQESIAIAKSIAAQGFQNWMFHKPNNINKEFKKIGFIKKFEPYNWFIGTGQYLDDFKNDFKQYTLLHLKNIKYKNNGYIFVIDKKGKMLLTRTGLTNISDIYKENVTLNKYNTFLNSNESETYIEFRYIDNKNEHSKISYLKKVSDFNWIIGTGFNLDNLNTIILKKQQELEEEHTEYINLIKKFTIVFTIILLVISYFLSKYIEKIFLKYKESILEKNKKLLQIQKIIKIGDWEFDLASNISYLSSNTLKIFGIEDTAEMFNGNYLKTIILEEDWQCYASSMKDCIHTSVPHSSTYRIKRPNDGKVVWIECLGTLTSHNTVLGSVQDITEKKLAHEEKLRTQKLFLNQSKQAAMGEMIGNIAHQWRQPLSIISTASTSIIMQKELGMLDETKLIKICNTINDNSQYLSKTIDDFKNFIKGDRTKNTFNLNDTIDSFLNLVEGSVKNHQINIIKDIPEDIQINAYENELKQCLINIFNNAKDALNENISDQDNKLIFISTSRNANNIIINITDNAGGIDKEIITKIFEPYFTTKHESVGTGIGLNMTYNLIVDGMNGTIDANNVNYKYNNETFDGAQFIISLPIN